MIQIKKLQLRTISFILTLAVLIGCVSASAMAEESAPNHVDTKNGDVVQRTYDSGNVILSNQVKKQKDNTFAVKLKVNIKDIKKISGEGNPDSSESSSSVSSASSNASSAVSAQSSSAVSSVASAPSASSAENSAVSSPSSKVDSTVSSAVSSSTQAATAPAVPEESSSALNAASSDPSLVSSAPSALKPQNVQKRSLLTRAAEESQPEDAVYEVRYYIQPNFVLTSVPQKAIYEEDSGYLSWSDLTAKDISSFSVDLKLKPVEDVKDSDDSSVTEAEDQSGVYLYGEPLYLFAQAVIKPDLLPPITAKTATLKNWDARTYDINLSVTAQSKIENLTIPCDIVLVLDRSGSMKDPIYSPVDPSQVDTKKEYYVLVNGTYQQVYHTVDNIYSGYTWRYGNVGDDNFTRVDPKTNGMGELNYIQAAGVHSAYKYYINVNGNYQEVTYKDKLLASDGWYYGGIFGLGDIRVQPSQWWPLESVKQYPFLVQSRSYQFYTLQENTISKLDALKEAANNFVTTVKQKSPDSRIGVVSFASNAKIETNLNGKQLLRVGNDSSEVNIRNGIDGLKADGFTAADLGMEKAKNLFDATKNYESVTSESPRNKAVIFFTDGEPNRKNGFDQNVANATISQSNTLKAAPYNASVYSIGIFSALNGSSLSKVEEYMTKTASPNKYYPVNDADALNEVFQVISKEVGGLSGVSVTDVIDPRFELTEASQKQLKDDKASIISNSIGTQITWAIEKIEVKKDAAGNLIPDWRKSFTVKAKDEFIGGNNIPTNVENSSGVSYGINTFVKFPLPTVNVKPEFYVGNAENTIFYGEETPAVTLNRYKVLGKDIFCGKQPTGTFSCQWVKADGTLVSDSEQFPSQQIPENDAAYTLKTTFTPYSSTDASRKNSNNNTAQATQNSVIEGICESKYTVHMIKGQLDITKIIDKQYPASNGSNAQQSFLFKIERRDIPDGLVIDTFYEVITPDSANNSGTKTITGLKKGYYTVTEESGAWRYSQKEVKDNDDTLNNPGTVYIGRQISTDNPKNYFGTFENPAKVELTNTLKNNQWISGTDTVVNTIKH